MKNVSSAIILVTVILFIIGGCSSPPVNPPPFVNSSRIEFYEYDQSTTGLNQVSYQIDNALPSDPLAVNYINLNNTQIEQKTLTFRKSGYKTLSVKITHAEFLRNLKLYLEADNLSPTVPYEVSLRVTTNFSPPTSTSNVFPVEIIRFFSPYFSAVPYNMTTPYQAINYERFFQNSTIIRFPNRSTKLELEGINDDTRIDVVLDDGNLIIPPPGSGN